MIREFVGLLLGAFMVLLAITFFGAVIAMLIPHNELALPTLIGSALIFTGLFVADYYLAEPDYGCEEDE